ncbi:RING/U-box, partial [Gyrodon lividus]
GRVEVVRRRVTRDGRTKLKMSLLGVSVENCAICMTQMRQGDKSILGATCKHAFHEKCLESWLARSQTCPLCRERLDACD